MGTESTAVGVRQPLKADSAYAEIESGPLLDQSEKPLFVAGTERHYQEFWIPVHSRHACDQVDWPAIDCSAMV